MEDFLKDKKLVMTIAIGIVLILIFCIFFYFPARGKIKTVNTELRAIQREIADIESIDGVEGKSMSEALDYLQKKYDKIFQMLPSQEENALKVLSELAKDLNLEIVSLRPAEKIRTLDEKGNPVRVEGLTCFEMPMTITMKGRYKAMGEYVKQLRDGDFPILIKLDTMEIKKQEVDNIRLDADFDLKLYLLCEDSS